MTVFLSLLALAAITWLFRITFITLVPADRLPAAVRARMDAVGPAAFAALLATEVAGTSPADLAPLLVAGAAAALAAWRTHNHLLAVLAAVAAWSGATLVL
jgi:branched-subunit amino acid transport protein